MQGKSTTAQPKVTQATILARKEAEKREKQAQEEREKLAAAKLVCFCILGSFNELFTFSGAT